MTAIGQDISTDFYSGNSKTIRVLVTKKDGSPKSLVSAETTYTMVTDKGVIVLSKSSAAGPSEIEYLDAANGELAIKLIPQDTFNLVGTFRHYGNVVDSNGEVETVFTGKVNISKDYAQRYRRDHRAIYVVGI